MSAAAGRAGPGGTLDGGALREFVRRMPKVELHVHLEGSMTPATLLRLAARHGVRLPAGDVEGVRRWFEFEDFEQFVEIYLACCACLRDPEDFQLVARDFLELQGRHQVLYTEAHFTIGTHLANGANGGEVADALWEVLVEGDRRGVSVRLIPDLVRDLGPRRAEATLGWALDARRHGVVALGLSGFENEPVEPFREHFRAAADGGLRRVAHAGEHGGADSIRAVLDHCGAERIGHGVRALDDPGTVERLRSAGVPLEVCPTSNLRLGVAPSYAEHPFDALRRAGLEVTVNSDDPGFFATTLSEEYQALAGAFGYGAAELEALARAALRHAFLEAPARERLEGEFDRRFAALAAELGAPG